MRRDCSRERPGPSARRRVREKQDIGCADRVLFAPPRAAGGGEKLNKTKMLAMQLSKRTGFLKCEYLQDRVEMSGQAITYLKGTIAVNISH